MSREKIAIICLMLALLLTNITLIIKCRLIKAQEEDMALSNRLIYLQQWKINELQGE